jgi:hypothetical protein
MDAFAEEGLLVYRRDDEEKRTVEVTNGEVAFFALLAQDMLDLADKYKRDVDDVHRMFFEVSCDRNLLIKLLEGQKGVPKWELIEDLAVKDQASSEAYKYVLSQKGEDEVRKRRMFLQMK